MQNRSLNLWSSNCSLVILINSWEYTDSHWLSTQTEMKWMSLILTLIYSELVAVVLNLNVLWLLTWIQFKLYTTMLYPSFQEHQISMKLVICLLLRLPSQIAPTQRNSQFSQSSSRTMLDRFSISQVYQLLLGLTVDSLYSSL